MKIKSNLLSFLVMAFISVGCATTPQYNSDDIIDKYYNIYTSKVDVVEDLDNDDISSILREFVVNITTNEPTSWENLEVREAVYIINISTNVISSNYPVRASAIEIEIADGLIDDSIEYFKIKRPTWYSDMGATMANMSGRFIDKINKFEWQRNRDGENK